MDIINMYRFIRANRADGNKVKKRVSFVGGSRGIDARGLFLDGAAAVYEVFLKDTGASTHAVLIADIHDSSKDASYFCDAVQGAKTVSDLIQAFAASKPSSPINLILENPMNDDDLSIAVRTRRDIYRIQNIIHNLLTFDGFDRFDVVRELVGKNTVVVMELSHCNSLLKSLIEMGARANIMPPRAVYKAREPGESDIMLRCINIDKISFRSYFAREPTRQSLEEGGKKHRVIPRIPRLK